MKTNPVQFPLVPDPKVIRDQRREADKRALWFLWVPLGAVVAFVITLLSGEGSVFLPAWGVISVILWGAGSGFRRSE